MKNKFFVCLTSMMIVALMISSAYAQCTLNLRTYFEGFIKSGTTNMRSSIYPVLTPEIADTMTIELRDAVNGNLVASEKTLVDTNGYSVTFFPSVASGSNLYIVLKHRNCVETWSSNPVIFSNNTSYDFSLSQSQAYGNNMAMVNGVAAIFSGDINQDGNIDIIDFSLWQSAADSFLFGYRPEDLNGDINVDNSDYTFWQPNASAFISAIIPLFTDVAENTKENRVEIFPNPASNYFNVSISNTSPTDEFYIYSLTGNLIDRIECDLNLTKVDVSEYPSGIYLLKHTYLGKAYSEKFVIIH